MAIKYIFCINPGRAGSNYLTALFKHGVNVASESEPMPIMHGRPMRDFNNGDEAALRQLMPSKLAQIQKARGRTGKIYVETNHQFIQGFGYLIPEFLAQEEIGVVVLRRDVEKSAYSRLRIHDVPGRNEWARTWVFDPADTRNLLPLAAAASHYERCLWHVREAFARGEAYREQFPNIIYFDVDLSDLNDEATILQMFETFGVRPKSSLTDAIGKRVNPRNEWPPYTIEELERPPIYPSIDALSIEQQSTMINSMVAWLLENRADEIVHWTPNWEIFGTYMFHANQVFAYAERELEDVFQTSLFFTDAEYQIIMTLMQKVRPNDIMFAFSDEMIDYTRQPLQLELNVVPDGAANRRIFIAFARLLRDRLLYRVGIR